MEAIGILLSKGDVEQVSERFRKRNFVVTIDHDKQCPKPIQFQLVQDNVGMIDNIPLGVMVKVRFGLNGKEWVNQQGEKMYFNTLIAWNVSMPHATTKEPVKEEKQHPVAQNQHPGIHTGSPDDDLPF